MNMVKSFWKRQLLVLLALLFAPIASAVRADEHLAAVIVPDREELTVGDVVRLTLQVTHPAGYRLQPIQADDAWTDFEVRDISAISVTGHDDGSETSSQVLDVTLWAPGAYTTPSFSVELIDEDGRVQAIEVAPIPLMVTPVLVEGDEELRDIKPQAELPVPAIWPWIMVGLLLAALGGRRLRHWWQRRQAAGSEVHDGAPDLRPAYQIALDELARIEQLGLPARDEFKSHYTLVADALRRYLEAGYAVPAMDKTTGEIQRALKLLSLPATCKSDLIDLLSEADFVKFARVIPEMASAVRFPDDAREFVLATRPRPEMPSPNGEARDLMGTSI